MVTEIKQYLAAALSPDTPWNFRIREDIKADLKNLIVRIETTLVIESHIIRRGAELNG